MNQIQYKRITDQKWEAFCEVLPDIRGEGSTPQEALDNLTDKLRSILQAVIQIQIGLCNDTE